MAWRRSGDKPLSEPMMVSLLTHICVTRPQWVNQIRYYIVPVNEMIINMKWFICGFICVSLCHSIKIKPTKQYITSTRVQFKIITQGCWNWHLCIPDGLSVFQCSLRHVIGIVFFDTISVAWSDLLDNWQLVVLPQSGGREIYGSPIFTRVAVTWLKDRAPG